MLNIFIVAYEKIQFINFPRKYIVADMTIYDKIPEIKISFALIPKKDIPSRVKSLMTTFLYTKVSTSSETREVRNDSKPKVRILKGNVINFTIGSRIKDKKDRIVPATTKLKKGPSTLSPFRKSEARKREAEFVNIAFKMPFIS